MLLNSELEQFEKSFPREADWETYTKMFIFYLYIRLYLCSCNHLFTHYCVIFLGATLPLWHRNEALRALVTLSASAPVISTSVFPSVYFNCHSSLVPSGQRNNPGDLGRCNICINYLTLKKLRLGCHSHSDSPNPGPNSMHVCAISHFHWCMEDVCRILCQIMFIFCQALTKTACVALAFLAWPWNDHLCLGPHLTYCTGAVYSIMPHH